MTEILTGLLVVLTGFYAWTTFRILKVNNAVVDKMHEQNRMYSRPYIQPSLYIVEGTNIFALRIRNNGLTTARGLNLTIDRNFFTFGKHVESSNLRNMSAFSGTIASLSPGEEIDFWLVQGPMIFSEDVDQSILPQTFRVDARYAFSDKSVCEETMVDFRPYKHASPPQNYLVKELKEIRKAISKLEGC